MSLWQEKKMEEKLIGILRDVLPCEPAHHFGRPFTTSYQLALAFHRLYPNTVDELNKKVGGKGIGEHHSLAQYIAGGLSRLVKEDSSPVEGAFLSLCGGEALRYTSGEVSVESSLTQTQRLSMYRLREEGKPESL